MPARKSPSVDLVEIWEGLDRLSFGDPIPELVLLVLACAFVVPQLRQLLLEILVRIANCIESFAESLNKPDSPPSATAGWRRRLIKELLYLASDLRRLKKMLRRSARFTILAIAALIAALMLAVFKIFTSK